MNDIVFFGYKSIDYENNMIKNRKIIPECNNFNINQNQINIFDNKNDIILESISQNDNTNGYPNRDIFDQRSEYPSRNEPKTKPEDVNFLNNQKSIYNLSENIIMELNSIFNTKQTPFLNDKNAE